MSSSKLDIEIYDLKNKYSERITVEELSENIYKALENAVFTEELSFSTIFEAHINDNGQYQIDRIVKNSEYITKRFMLTTQFKESEYRLLGDEIIKLGGFWQVDFGSLAIINIPQEKESYIEEIFKIFNFNLPE